MMQAGARRWLLVCAAALAFSCGNATDGGAWIEAAQTDSAAADRAIAAGSHDEAAQHLRAIVERAVPSGVAEEDARVVRQDAYDRWAQLEMKRGSHAEAMELVGRGLALGERTDIFTANLLTTRGKIHEETGRDREAARDYHRALRIEERLLERALGGADEP